MLEVRFWLLADIQPHPELLPLYPRKRTFGGLSHNQSDHAGAIDRRYRGGVHQDDRGAKGFFGRIQDHHYGR